MTAVDVQQFLWRAAGTVPEWRWTVIGGLLAFLALLLLVVVHVALWARDEP